MAECELSIRISSVVPERGGPMTNSNRPSMGSMLRFIGQRSILARVLVAGFWSLVAISAEARNQGPWTRLSPLSPSPPDSRRGCHGYVHLRGSRRTDFPSCYRQEDCFGGCRPCGGRSADGDSSSRTHVRTWRRSIRGFPASEHGTPGAAPVPPRGPGGPKFRHRVS